MRAVLIQALREYYGDGDDATTAPTLIGSQAGIPYPDPNRLARLLLKALREHETEIRALEARVAALEAR